MYRSIAPGLLLLLAALAGTAGAQPREAACTAPAGPLQAMICGDAELRGADRRLHALDRAIGATTPRPATMAHRATAWQRQLEAGEEGRPLTLVALRGAYAERVATLEETLRQDRALRGLERRGPVLARPAGLERRCLGTALRNCRVSASGLLVSEDRRARILWQSQTGFTEVDGVRAGIILLAEAPGGWRLIGWSFEGVRFGAPGLVAEDGGLLLAVPGRLGGSGGGNADLLYQLRPGGWRDIDLESWMTALPAHIPPGLGIWQGVDYDFTRLRARSRLWRETDANCCATGGNATLRFRITGDALALEEVTVD